MATRMSRRQFIGGSVAAGLAGAVPWGPGPAQPDASLMQEEGRGLTLHVAGDAAQGYGVVILFQGQPFARHNSGAEFSAIFQNGERSLHDRTDNWKASSWTGNETRVMLRGECKLPNLNATVFAQVEYEIVTPHVLRKKIRFHQVDMYVLFYQVTNSLEPLEAPQKFWSFNQVDCRGGALHEYYPVAGFRTNSGITVGLLTDSGDRNHWSRLIRRDWKPLKPAPQRIPDVRLNYVCRPEEQASNQFFVKQTFGESLAPTESETSGEALVLPLLSSWRKQGDVRLEQRNGTTVLSTESSDGGVIIPFPAKDGEIYSLHLEYRSPQAFAVQVWDVDDHLNKLEDITLYNDRIPESPVQWSEFRIPVFFYSLRGRSGALFISMPQSEQGLALDAPSRSGAIELRVLEVRRVRTHYEPYHRLEMDRAEEKTSFIFADESTPDTVRGYRLSSQTHLADALSFRGGQLEKVLYSDLMMLSWAAEPEYLQPMVAPSIWYSAAGEMYMRDSFFALNGVHDRELNEHVFDLWAANQGADGAINTLVEPNRANLERKSNDSTPLWLMWALQNHLRFGTKLPMEKIRKAAEYCLHTYDRNHDGICWAQFVMGQLDVIDYPEGTSEICENQGMLAVTLRVIKELKIPCVSEQISEGHIEKAEEA